MAPRLFSVSICSLTLSLLSTFLSAQEYKVVKVNPKDVSEIEFEDFAYDISVVKLENSDEAIFGKIDKLFVTPKRLYVMMGGYSAGVFAYTREGKYLFRVVATGQGPQEVDRITNISVDGDDLMVYGDLSHRVLRYSPEGEFIKAYKIDFYARNFTKVPEGWLFYLQEFTAEEKGGVRLALTDEEFQVQRYFFKPLKTAMGYAGRYNIFTSNGNSRRFSLTLGDTIHSVKGIQVQPEWFVDFGKFAISEPLKNPKLSGREGMVRMSKANYSALVAAKYSLNGITGAQYGRRRGSDGITERMIQLDEQTGDVIRHFYYPRLSKYKARMPFNDYCFEGKVITVASFLTLFDGNNEESEKESRQGVSEGYGIYSLDEALKVMKAEDNPYLFFYSIKK